MLGFSIISYSRDFFEMHFFTVFIYTTFQFNIIFVLWNFQKNQKNYLKNIFHFWKVSRYLFYTIKKFCCDANEYVRVKFQENTKKAKINIEITKFVFLLCIKRFFHTWYPSVPCNYNKNFDLLHRYTEIKCCISIQKCNKLYFDL